MRSILTSPFVKGLVGAVVGGVLVYLALHVWADHRALHDLAQYLNQVAPKINKLP